MHVVYINIPPHPQRYYEVSCGSDLQVTFLIGFAIELGACLVDTWLNMQTISSMSLLDELIKYTNAAAMIALGEDLKKKIIILVISFFRISPLCICYCLFDDCMIYSAVCFLFQSFLRGG